MRIFNSFSHVATGAMLMMLLWVLLSDLYAGDLPNCNGEAPGSNQACPDTKPVSCPGNVSQAACVNPANNYICTILQNIPYKCVQPTKQNPNIFCTTQQGVCAINYWCSWGVPPGDIFYRCWCDPSGTVYSKTYTNNIGASEDCVVGS